MLTSILDAARANPVRVATYAAAIVVFIAAKAGIVIDEQSVLNAALIVVPIILAGEKARRDVVPLHNLTVPAALHAEVAAKDEVSQP